MKKSIQLKNLIIILACGFVLHQTYNIGKKHERAVRKKKVDTIATYQIQEYNSRMKADYAKPLVELVFSRAIHWFNYDR